MILKICHTNIFRLHYNVTPVLRWHISCCIIYHLLTHFWILLDASFTLLCKSIVYLKSLWKPRKLGENLLLTDLTTKFGVILGFIMASFPMANWHLTIGFWTNSSLSFQFSEIVGGLALTENGWQKRVRFTSLTVKSWGLKALPFATHTFIQKILQTWLLPGLAAKLFKHQMMLKSIMVYS